MRNNVLAFFICLMIPIGLLAQATADTDGNWSNTGSWVAGNIGDGGESVISNQDIDLVIQTGETYTISSFTVGKNGSLTIETGGVLIITGNFIGDKVFALNVEGTLDVQGNLDLSKSSVSSIGGAITIGGDVNVGKDAAVDIQGSMDVAGDFVADKNAVINVDGTLDIVGDLNLGTGSVITGTGPVTAGTCSGAACSDGQLPIELIYFKAELNTTELILLWATASEENNDFFTIEHSSDGNTFDVLVEIDGAGNSFEKILYQYKVDKIPSITTYYRLKQTDFDGKYTYSDIVSVRPNNKRSAFGIYPNPSSGENITVLLQNYRKGDTSIEILDSSGGHVYSTSLTVKSMYEVAQLRLPSKLKKGYYIVHIKSNSGDFQKKLLVH